jgi:glycine/D-amino acid oxidase-like deaminating enzyme
MTEHYRSLSFWLDGAGDLSPRASLPGDIDADVAIIGAGLTGLWTAYYLIDADPSLRVVVLEKEVAGFGSSGRNGGWCSAYFPVSRETLAEQHGPATATAIQRAMFETVDEVGRVCEAESIAADFVKSGALGVCTNAPQAERQRAAIAQAHSLGFTEDDYRWLSADEAREIVAVDGCIGAEWTPHNATLDPAKLTRGLARVVEARGVRIYEGTEVTGIAPGKVRTPHGTVRCEISVRALEAYTASVQGHERLISPLHIFMIATEPLPASFWAEVGWRNRECVNDARRMFSYAQRTADDRIALGAGGISRHLGYATDERQGSGAVYEEIRRQMIALWPGAADAAITHRWGGYIGIPRDWYPSVGLRRETGLAWAGGYVGDGVPASNLAGRTLRDLIMRRDSDIVRMPWVDHRWRLWEPEPLRWLGSTFVYRSMVHFDRVEDRTGRPSRAAPLVERLIGR